jgi:hypothetical protein
LRSRSNGVVEALGKAAAALKIGKSAGHPSARLADLQCGNPHTLQLLAWTLSLTEAQAHRRLRSWHLRGEWFTVNRPVLAYLDCHFDWLDLGLRSSLRKATRAVDESTTREVAVS